jgi:filamin
VPKVAGAELLVLAKYNGNDVANTWVHSIMNEYAPLSPPKILLHLTSSPVNLKVKPRVEPEKVKVKGDGLSPRGIPASLPTQFQIDTSEAGYGDLEVGLTGPDHRPRKVVVSQDGDGKFLAQYTPDDTGPYQINVKYGGKPVGSPVTVKAYSTGNAEKCRITEGRQQSLRVGQEQCVTINCSSAGTGAVTCRIQSAEGK